MLQPVAHSLLQCREEVEAHLPSVSHAQLFARPSGAASIAYHVRHAIGSLDRLFTYARGEALSAEQMATLKAEGEVDEDPDAAAKLVSAFADAVDRALAYLRQTDERTLPDLREVGRARLPSTVIGLLFHAAEHTQRHIGQMVTTIKMFHLR
jgi:hypothetical protein